MRLNHVWKLPEQIILRTFSGLCVIDTEICHCRITDILARALLR